MPDNNKINVHEHHRQRMKNRFLKEGFDVFADHEKLEMLLFYAVPRQNTNEIGHELLRTFGSFSRVLEADISELCKIKGISEHSAILIKMILPICNAYLLDRQPDIQTYEYDEMGKYFCAYFAGFTTESCCAVFLDNSLNIISMERLADGEVNALNLNLRHIATQAVKLGASSVVLAHNHPRGTVIPSAIDIETTNAASNSLGLLQINLIEHYIIAGDRYSGVVKKTMSRVSEDFRHLIFNYEL